MATVGMIRLNRFPLITNFTDPIIHHNHSVILAASIAFEGFPVPFCCMIETGIVIGTIKVPVSAPFFRLKGHTFLGNA
jgi:hypothetical protein